MPHLGTRAAQVIAAPQEAWRTDTPQRKRAYARRRGIDTTKLKTVEQLDQALEKVIGDRDFLPSRWIRRAATRPRPWPGCGRRPTSAPGSSSPRGC